MNYDYEIRFITGRKKENHKEFFNVMTIKTGEPGKEVIALLEWELFKFRKYDDEDRLVRHSMVESMSAADAAAARQPDYDFKPSMRFSSDSKSALIDAIQCDIQDRSDIPLPKIWMDYLDEVIPDDVYHKPWSEHTEETYNALLEKDPTYQRSLSQQEKPHDRDNPD